jgi:Uri superfamily endonuclease
MPRNLRAPGTYMVFVELPGCQKITVRSLHTFLLPAGAYCYLGSAMGPGGLASRLRRHASESSRKHWHIDFLIPHVKQAGALVVHSTDRLECEWASWASRAGADCVNGFGASDCTCKGHLFRINDGLGAGRFADLAHHNLGGLIVTGNEIRNLDA